MKHIYLITESLRMDKTSQFQPVTGLTQQSQQHPISSSRYNTVTGKALALLWTNRIAHLIFLHFLTHKFSSFFFVLLNLEEKKKHDHSFNLSGQVARKGEK